LKKYYKIKKNKIRGMIEEKEEEVEEEESV
jgi:hypothetical protein